MRSRSILIGTLLVLASAAPNLPQPQAELSTSIPEPHAAHQGKTSPPKATMREPRRTVAGPKLPPLLPVVDQPDIELKHKLIADEVLRIIPASCRARIENFYVRYDSPRQRGLAGKTSVIVSGTVPDPEFRALLIHEIFGHVVDLGCLEGTPESGPSSFRDGTESIYRNDPSLGFYSISWVTETQKRSSARASDFVSGYAARDAFEDFAESIAYYLLQEEAFRERARLNPLLAQKLLWLERNLFPSRRKIATGKHVWDGKTVPWDVTKLPYAWHPERALVKRD